VLHGTGAQVCNQPGPRPGLQKPRAYGQKTFIQRESKKLLTESCFVTRRRILDSYYERLGIISPKQLLLPIYFLPLSKPSYKGNWQLCNL